MKLWRIAAETRDYAATDLSGAGAARHPGRWNDYGEPVVYCAPTIAMAVLETAAHIDDGGLPLNRYLVEIDVAETLWARHEDTRAATLPSTWGAIPAGQASVRFGSRWLACWYDQYLWPARRVDPCGAGVGVAPGWLGGPPS